MKANGVFAAMTAGASITTSTLWTRTWACASCASRSWAPFRLQFYTNGHSALEAELKKEGIAYVMEDNSFVEVADFERAQQLSQKFTAELLRRKLDSYARLLCPVVQRFPKGYHW